MTEERVIFTLDSLALHTGKMQQLLIGAFGFKLPTLKAYSSWEPIDIVCRLDQFARFIILWNAIGIPNRIKSLNPKVVPNPSLPVRRIYNVSENLEMVK